NGEVSGAKIAGALEMALKDCETGKITLPIIVFDTGGVRLQEANFGLLAIAEIGAAIVALRRYTPIIGIIPGKIGAFGGMSITAGLCSALIMTREARLGLNGPEVIEQEAGVREVDSKDKQLIWGMAGGKQRTSAGFADVLVEDDSEAIKRAVSSIQNGEITIPARTEQVERYQAFLSLVNPMNRLSPEEVRELWLHSGSTVKTREEARSNDTKSAGRGQKWFDLLRGSAKEIGDVPSVRVADSWIGEEKVRYIAVVPDENNRFPQARKGEVGIEEGWSIAKFVRQAMEMDHDGEKRVIVAIVDVPSQAYGYHEELLGIHQSCAAAVDAYASARLAGHAVISFIPGNAISGAFLSHGMQANRLIALSDDQVNVHVMSKQSAARITRRSLEELETATKKVPSMAYDIFSFQKLGALFSLVQGIDADTPGGTDRDIVLKEIERAVMDTRLSGLNDLSVRLSSTYSRNGGRNASILVRKEISEQWG
ncbi:biotin-independent malonate decarboxylase subunit gamma, partial [Bacillus xiapuensis]|nr:biotin-independent malonate decarboxylase subunit gamma [Bacillus xiapuensis]